MATAASPAKPAAVKALATASTTAAADGGDDAAQPIDFHDLTASEATSAVSEAITLLMGLIRPPAEDAHGRSAVATPASAAVGSGAGAAGGFSFASKFKSVISMTPSFLRNLVGGSNANGPESPERPAAMAGASLSSPSADDKENGGAAVFGVSINDVDLCHNGSLLVPTVVDMLMKEIRGKGLQHEGIFRVAGNKRRVKALRRHLDRREPIPAAEAAEATVHDYADLLKEFLRCLPESLIAGPNAPIYMGVSRLQATSDARQMVRAFASRRRFFCTAWRRTRTHVDAGAAGAGRGRFHAPPAFDAAAFPCAPAAAATRLPAGDRALPRGRRRHEPREQNARRQLGQGRRPRPNCENFGARASSTHRPCGHGVWRASPPLGVCAQRVQVRCAAVVDRHG